MTALRVQSLFCCLTIAAMASAESRFDVTQFGAKGDGRTLDASPINQAVPVHDDAGDGVEFHMAQSNLHLKAPD